MFKLDDNLLRELGLGDLPPHEKNSMLGHIYETLEMRVGVKLAQGMTDDQLREFEQLMPLEQDSVEIRKDKEQQALRWLETNFPDYKKVVAEELENLKSEIKASAPQILESSRQAQAQQANIAQQQPQQPSQQHNQQPQPPQQQPPAMPQQPAA